MFEQLCSPAGLFGRSKLSCFHRPLLRRESVAIARIARHHAAVKSKEEVAAATEVLRLDVLTAAHTTSRFERFGHDATRKELGLAKPITGHSSAFASVRTELWGGCGRRTRSWNRSRRTRGWRRRKKRRLDRRRGGRRIVERAPFKLIRLVGVEIAGRFEELTAHALTEKPHASKHQDRNEKKDNEVFEERLTFQSFTGKGGRNQSFRDFRKDGRSQDAVRPSEKQSAPHESRLPRGRDLR